MAEAALVVGRAAPEALVAQTVVKVVEVARRAAE